VTTTIDTAVILAAGVGRRLRPVSEKLPKGMVEVEGRPLLARSLDALADHGVRHVILVVGYKADHIRTALGTEHRGMTLTYVDNPRFADSGSMVSLCAARNIALDAREGILLLESDLLYDPTAIARVQGTPHPDVTLAARITGTGDDVYLCTDRHGRLTGLGKELPPEDRRDAVGCLVGISRLSTRFLQVLFQRADAEFATGDPLALDQHYEDCIANSATAEMPVHVEVDDDLVWTEIDNEADLERARSVIAPQLARETTS